MTHPQEFQAKTQTAFKLEDAHLESRLAVATEIDLSKPNDAAPPPIGEIRSRAQALYNSILGVFVSNRMNNHLAGLDTIRGLAVLFVVLVHSWGFTGAPVVNVPIPLTDLTLPWSEMVSRMGSGVDIFFVLSGFLLAIPWHKAQVQGKPAPHVGTYLKRRMWRIVPPYWFMLIIILALLTGSVIPLSTVASRQGTASVVASFLFLHQALPFSSNGVPPFANVNGAIWTLTIEMAFYLVLPWFVLAFTHRRWRWGLPLTGVISLLYLLIVRYPPQPLANAVLLFAPHHQMPFYAMQIYLSDQFPAFLPEFGIGVTIANWWVNKQSLSVHPHWRRFNTPFAGTAYALLGTSLMIWLLCHPVTWPTYDYYGSKITAAIAAGLLVMGALHGTAFVQAAYRFLPLRLFGIAGYSIFLWHLPLINVIRAYPIIAQRPPVIGYLHCLELALPIVTVVGFALYFIVEKPLIENRPKL